MGYCRKVTNPCLPECGVARFLTLLNGPWATLIVRELLAGPHRFTELRQALPGISPHTLTSRLRQFENHAIVIRTTYAEMPPRVEYRLTPSARGCATFSTPWRPGPIRCPPRRLPSRSWSRGQVSSGERAGLMAG